MWGKQYHESKRVYSPKGMSVTISATTTSGIYVKRWKRNVNKSE